MTALAPEPRFADAAMDEPPAPTLLDALEENAPASKLMSALADIIVEEHVSAGELIDRLHGRGIGLLLLILSLPLCIPNIPGISTIFGVLLLAPAIQLIRHRPNIWAPRRIRDISLSGPQLRKALDASARILERVERLTRPRLRVLSRWPVTGLIGVQTLIMALVLIIPMPGANFIPAVAVALTGIGLLQRDGAATLLSIPIALFALAWVYFGATYTIRFMSWLVDWAAGLIGVAT